MTRLFFSLSISAEDYLSYYQGKGNAVVAQTEDGKQLQFPAKELRNFVTHSGIHGRFEITFDDAHKLLKLQRAAPRER